MRGPSKVLIVAVIALWCRFHLGPSGDRPLRIWAHAGREEERHVLQQLAAEFARGHGKIQLSLLPEGSYNSQVQAAALGGNLPDVLEFDGPLMYNYAWQGKLLPLDEFIGKERLADLLPSVLTQGTYRGRLYSVAMFDSGLGLFARTSALKLAGARIPRGGSQSWSAAEFREVLARLADADPDGAVLDLKRNYRGEWWTLRPRSSCWGWRSIPRPLTRWPG